MLKRSKKFTYGKEAHFEDMFKLEDNDCPLVIGPIICPVNRISGIRHADLLKIREVEKINL